MVTSEKQLGLCPSDELAAYLDGELGTSREREVEGHIAACSSCAEELNDQKHFLRSLDVLKESRTVDIPADFTKKVVANAESTVAGLRRGRERFNALFICAGLGLFVLFAIGPNLGQIAGSAADSGERGFAVANFVAEVFISFFVGIAIVVRSFVGQFGSEALLLALVSVFAAFILVLFSRRLFRFDRA